MLTLFIVGGFSSGAVVPEVPEAPLLDDELDEDELDDEVSAGVPLDAAPLVPDEPEVPVGVGVGLLELAQPTITAAKTALQKGVFIRALLLRPGCRATPPAPAQPRQAAPNSTGPSILVPSRVHAPRMMLRSSPAEAPMKNLIVTGLAALTLTTACGGGGGGRGHAHHPPPPETRGANEPVAPGARAEERRDDARDRKIEARTGWDKLGERMVDGKVDKDVIPVGRAEGKFSQVMVVVEHSALEMYDMEITFGDGSKFSPPTRLMFEKNTTSRVIDLPGDKRVIRQVAFRYGNLPGGGRAQVELWAK